jgi:hypothetical protein
MLPPLRFLHEVSLLNPVKLATFCRLTTEEIKLSLQPDQPGALKARPDGTVLDGHHRLCILQDRGVDIHRLPREIIEKGL